MMPIDVTPDEVEHLAADTPGIDSSCGPAQCQVIFEIDAAFVLDHDVS